MSEYLNYENNAAFNYFKEICKIPHGSGNEKSIADYIENFARERKLFVYRDEFNNVLIRKSAHKGFEDRPSVLLQGHTDMVCEKNADTEFDFLTEPLRLAVKDGFLYAEGTTLGADDGVAVALMLAFLDDENLEAPELECLFTTGEETALVGATNFDYSQIKSHSMINMDTEYEGEAVAGSAGGVRCRIVKAPEYTHASGETLKITVGGLKGGHSGADIALGRTSAAVVAARLLKLIEGTASLASFVGGNMDNAIAREFTLTVVTEDAEAVKATVNDLEETVRAKVAQEDSGFYIKVEAVKCEEKGAENMVFTEKFESEFSSLISEIPHGVYAMSRDMEGLVESSANFASVKEGDGEIVISVSMRSSVEASLEAMKERMALSAEKHGFTATFEGQYPGWQFNPNSRLAEVFKESYKEMTGRDGRVVAIHAGLECGLIKSSIRDMDIVSIGPTMYDIHTPNERLDIKSFLDFEKLVRIMLKK